MNGWIKNNLRDGSAQVRFYDICKIAQAIFIRRASDKNFQSEYQEDGVSIEEHLAHTHRVCWVCAETFYNFMQKKEKELLQD